MTSRLPIAPFAFEPVLSLVDKQYKGLQLVYQGDDSPGYQPSVGHRPPGITFLADLVAGWSQHGSPLRFTFPVSIPEVATEGFADAWLFETRRTGIEPSLVELGLAPTHPPAEGAHLARNLAQLREAGVGLCQLDFGSGYATIGGWRDLPLTRVEVSPAFIESQDAPSAQMLNSILRLAESCGLTSSVRGVANGAQLRMLEELNCQFARGPAIGPKLVSVQVDYWLQRNGARNGLGAYWQAQTSGRDEV